MQYVRVNERNGSDIIKLTLEPGDYVLESLITVAEKECIDAATILEGSSMVKGPIRLGFYDMERGAYGSFRDFENTYDVVSVAGNIVRHQDQDIGHVIHLHMSFSNAAELDYTVKGGHVMVEKKDVGAPQEGSRFKNDFQAAPTAEFTLLGLNGHNLERRKVQGCPAPLIMPKCSHLKAG